MESSVDIAGIAPTGEPSEIRATSGWAIRLLQLVERIDSRVSQLVHQRTIKDWYSTDEAGEILGKSEYTVREWCRNKRVHGKKKNSGRGKHQAWVISHEELLRIQREGLLPGARA